jgi:hypothetical protein
MCTRSRAHCAGPYGFGAPATTGNSQEKEKIMLEEIVAPKAIRIIVLAAIGLGATVDTSFAQFRHQQYQMCRDRVNGKGLKGDSWKAEYQKCKADPLNYK